MAECGRRMLPRLYPLPKNEGRLSIACFGPSLADTWQEIKRPVLTVSGAHRFLIDKGVVPEWHMDCDPRPHKLAYITPPHKDVTYLMASCCDPQTWEILQGHKVYIWHMHNGPETAEWIKENDPWAMLIGGGSTAGLRALQIGCLLGFKKFDIYGMDGNFRDGRFRTFASDAPPQNVVRLKLNGSEWKTTDLMLNAVVEYIRTIEYFPMIECVLHGDGMLKHIVEHFKQDKKNNAAVPLQPIHH